jgi:hypothetical protein
MKLRWSVAFIAVLVLVVVSAVCSARGQNALDKPGTKAGDTATGPDGGVYVWVPAGEFDMGRRISSRPCTTSASARASGWGSAR